MPEDNWTAEDEKELARLCKEKNKRDDWQRRVDDRDTDPDYNTEELQAEDEKYERYNEELVEINKKLDELVKRMPRYEIITKEEDREV